MKREIKFRGQSIENGQWVYGNVVIDTMTGNKACIIDWADMSEDNKDGGAYIWNDVIPQTVGQYTGLKDKNGKKVYEGDVDKSGHVIMYNEEKCMFCPHYYSMYYKIWNPSSYPMDASWTEIVGNIFDNPELLKQD